jgi:RimJ/RimL family protein N-acetyltransferase
MKTYRIGPETKRLEHRAFTVHDATALFALNGNPQVMRLTGEPLLPSVEAARQAIADYTDFDVVGYGRWACVLKETQTIIGFCGLKYLPDLDAVDVGYRFLPEYWNRGFATEACIASLDFGFKTLHLDEIIALVLPENVASIRVLEKAGMQPDGELLYDEMPVLRYLKRMPPPARRSAGSGPSG